MPYFLEPAVTATRRELNVTSADALARQARSGVIDVPEAERVSLLPARRRTFAWVVLAGLILVGGIVFVVAGQGVPGTVRVLVGIGSVVAALLTVVAAVAALFVGAMQVRGTAGRIPERRPPVPPGFARGETVAVEPAETYGRFKLVGDDVGILYHDPAGRRLLIDGAAHRYLIAWPDVEACEVAGGALTSGVRFDVRFGSERASIVIAMIGEAATTPTPAASDQADERQDWQDADDLDDGAASGDGDASEAEAGPPESLSVAAQFRARLLATLDPKAVDVS